MGFRYRKSINLGGGMRLNLSKKGVGFSVGVKGFRVSSGPSGRRITVSLPGTGISYTKNLGRADAEPYVALPNPFNEAPATASSLEPIVLHCLNCHSALIAGQDACHNCGRFIVQGVPKVGYSLAQFRLLALSVVAVLAFAVFAVVLLCSHYAEHRRLEALHLEQERQMHIARAITMLREAYPKRGYALCSTGATPIRINSTFSQACVRTVTLSQSDNVVTASLGLLGVQKEKQAPTIYVSLYDENGNMLSRSPIAKFTFAVLEYGETREVEDQMELPRGADPAIVSVDDGS